MAINCLIIDDDPVQVEIISSYISEIQNLELIEAVNSSQAGKKVISSKRIDILFLDIELPDTNGLQLLEELNVRPEVILISSHQNYAVDAFEYKVQDFLVKPIEFERFKNAVEKAKTALFEKSISISVNSFFFAKVGNNIVRIEYKNIRFVKAEGDYSVIVTKEKSHWVLLPISKFLEKLPAKTFIRIHRSNIINIENIDVISGDTIKTGDHLVPISRTYKSELFQKLNLW